MKGEAASSTWRWPRDSIAWRTWTESRAPTKVVGPSTWPCGCSPAYLPVRRSTRITENYQDRAIQTWKSHIRAARRTRRNDLQKDQLSVSKARFCRGYYPSAGQAKRPGTDHDGILKMLSEHPSSDGSSIVSHMTRNQVRAHATRI